MKNPEDHPQENVTKDQAMQELLNKLRIAQEDILHDTSGDVFAEGIEHLKNGPGHGEAQVKRFRAALDFARGCGRMAEEQIFAGFRENLTALSEMKDVYPVQDDSCSQLDYLMFVGSLIGGIPEDRFTERQLKGSLPDRDNAALNLKLTEKLIKASSDIPDGDLRALVMRSLLGGISFLELEESGGDDAEEPYDREKDTAELFAMAERYAVPRALVSRALELSQRQLEETMERRRRRKAARHRFKS